MVLGIVWSRTSTNLTRQLFFIRTVVKPINLTLSALKNLLNLEKACVQGRLIESFKRITLMDNTSKNFGKQENEYIDSEIRAAELERQCKEQTNQKTSIAYAPLPLQRSSFPAKPYPFDALGPIAGAAARRIHEVVQAPDATCGQSILRVLSLCWQGFVDVKIDGRRYPTSLFLLTVSDSGKRKSATDKIALKPINDW
ncbi:Uncharacterized protein PRO82_001069 [Candidatus Protochlamydia amoebophila]|nr:Uncharacterized protein [Candidatus Protochlamydia amoebophila]